MPAHHTFFVWMFGDYYETETRLMTHAEALSFAAAWGLEMLAW